MNNSQALLTCQNLSRRYADGQQQLTVLEDVNLSIADGDMVAIVGSSGSGKSTLLHCLGGLDHPSQGEVCFKGHSIRSWNANKLSDWRNHELGFIYQFHHLLPEFTALENIILPQLIGGVTHKEASARAVELLDLVGLQARRDHRPAELSGGERQRVAIARALANAPSVVLADEPTGNLDDDNAAQVFQLLKRLNQELNTTFVLVTHDQKLAAECPRVLELQHGKLVAHA